MGTRGFHKRSDLAKRVAHLQKKLFGPVARGKPLTGREEITEALLEGHPAFGGKLLRYAYQLIRKAIGDNYTLFASFAGPISASDYARVWVIPFIERGYISAFTASDAISYHDAHDAVEGKREIREVNLYGDDALHRDAQIIRITDIGFPEEVLFNTDKFMTWALQRKEFRRSMTTTEYRHALGRYLYALEEKRGIPHGLLATATAYDVPGFCPSPADGSTFLNAMKLWAMKHRLGERVNYGLTIDLAKDVYEFCGYHLWAQHHEGNKELAYVVCGGGAVKNYMLQPEPALAQILFIGETKMYQIGIQFTTAPVTEGSLSSCWPAEAISWGKLQKEALTVSCPVDYTMAMTVIAHAILRERTLYEEALEEEFHGDREALFQAQPQARGFLREPARLFQKREKAMALLDETARRHLPEMRETLRFS